MATARMTKLIAFKEDDWKTVHDAADYVGKSAHAFIRDTSIERATEVLEKKRLTEGE